MAGTAESRSDEQSTPRDHQPKLARRRRTDMAWPYIRGAALSVTCVWTFVGVYLAVTPQAYLSHWTLNLPGPAGSVSLSLESIGQSSSTPNSPFGNTALSPKVVYKEIAEGERVRWAAAALIGVEPGQFGKPRVKLIDETELLLFELTGSSPEEAKRRGDALLAAFNGELDRLRSDELQKRESAVRANLAGFQARVREARDASIAAQKESGLVSTIQFSEMVSSLTVLRRRLVELSGETGKLAEEQDRLAGGLGIGVREAGAALKLAADPNVQQALKDYHEATAVHAIDTERFGPQHPQFVASLQRNDATRERIKRLITQVSPDATRTVALESVVQLGAGSGRNDLYLNLVRNDAALEGKRRELASLTADHNKLAAEVARLSPAAARLEDLKKDQLVADAVFSTAMARLDSSKSDIYGSYPIVQVISPPDVARAAAQPRPFYAALGGLSGTLFACLAWMLAWLQFTHRAIRLRK